MGIGLFGFGFGLGFGIGIGIGLVEVCRLMGWGEGGLEVLLGLRSGVFGGRGMIGERCGMMVGGVVLLVVVEGLPMLVDLEPVRWGDGRTIACGGSLVRLLSRLRHASHRGANFHHVDRVGPDDVVARDVYQGRNARVVLVHTVVHVPWPLVVGALNP